MGIPQTPSGPTHQRVIAGIVSAAARFIPVPFVDDIVREQCARYVVTRTLIHHGADIESGTLNPLYSNGSGCVGGCLGTILKAPLILLLFPIRKMIAVVTSIRGVPVEVLRLVLLGRTLDRYLQSEFRTIGPADALTMRGAFDETFARMDFRVVRASIIDALATINGWKSAAMESAKAVAENRDGKTDDLGASDEVQNTATQIEEVLLRPEVASLFDDFDQRFDAAMHRRTVSE